MTIQNSYQSKILHDDIKKQFTNLLIGTPPLMAGNGALPFCNLRSLLFFILPIATAAHNTRKIHNMDHLKIKF